MNATITTLTDRQKQLFTALNNLTHITSNWTGEKDCSKPLEVTDPKMDAKVKGFPEGWNMLTCTARNNP